MIRWRYLFPVASLLFVAQVSHASDTAAKERAAKTACLAGDFAKGVEILSELYVSTNEVVFLFNQGRCFEQNHRYEDAISRFQEYLRVAKRISKADKTDAQKHIDDCQSLLAKQGDAASTSSAPVAGSPTSKESKERAAKKACLTGDPVRGVEILADLFIDTNDTAYLFNQGRCLEQNRRYEDAIGRFREYLIKTKTLRLEEKADAEKHIAACESYLAGKPAEAAKPEAPKKVTETPPPEPRPLAVVSTTEPQARPVPAGAGFRTAGAVVAAAGGAGLVAGLVLNLKANAMASDLESQYDPSVASSRKTYKTAAWIGYGAGAACLLGGAVLYYFGLRRSENAASLALVPTVGPDMTGTMLWGRF
jgi:tetratricopeptide (TPR) repeat protein